MQRQITKPFDVTSRIQEPYSLFLLPDGTIHDVNESFARLLETCLITDYYGKKIDHLLWDLGHLSPAIPENFTQTIQQKIFHLRLFHRDGNKAFVTWILTPVLNGIQVEGWQMFGIDTQADNIPERSDYVFLTSFRVPAWIYDTRNYAILFVNQAAIDTYGYTREEFLARSIFDLRPDSETGKLESELRGINEIPYNSGQFVHQKKNGELFEVQVISGSFPPDADHLRLVFAASPDYKEQKLAEEALRASEERYRAFVHQSSEGIWLAELPQPVSVKLPPEEQIRIILETGFIAECNDEMARMYGFENSSALSGVKLTQFVDAAHPSSYALAIQFIESGYALTEAKTLEQDRAGNKKYFTNNIKGIVENNLLVRIWGTQRDITAQNLAEKALMESEQRFRYMADHAPVMIWLSDIEDKTTYVNSRLLQFAGENSSADLTALWQTIIHPEDIPEAITKYREFFLERKPISLVYRLRKASGEYRWVMDHAVPRILEDGSFIGYIGSIMDIHDRKLAEDQVRFMASLIDQVSDIIISTDLDNVILSWNKAAENFYGISKEKAIGVNISNIIRYDFLQQTFESVNREFEQKGSWTGEVAFLDDGGNRSYLHSSVTFIRDSSGKKIGKVAVNRDVNERKKAEREMLNYSSKITNILGSITDGFFSLDNQMLVALWNQEAERITGTESTEIIGKRIWEKLPDFFSENLHREFRKALERNITVTFEHYVAAEKLWLEMNVYPYEHGLFVYFKDVTTRHNQESLLALEKKVLEISASPLSGLSASLDFFLEGIEKIVGDMRCSVLLLDEDRKTLRHLSAPSLPVEYCQLIDGEKIGPEAGSCGTAMFLKKRVIVGDIHRSPLWKKYLPAVMPYGLRACWSLPILSSAGNVIASFASYYLVPKLPNETELNLIERAANLIKIIIENKKAEEKLRISNERYFLATRATKDAIWDWDIATQFVYWGEAFFPQFGYASTGEETLRFEFWKENIHPDDRDRVVNGLRRFVSEKRRDSWQDEYRFRRGDNKEYALVIDRGFLVLNDKEEVIRMIGSMEDITESRELEKKLLKQELDKQRVVAQAMVDTQEKERAEIGKELHDNVNQILSTTKLYLELAKSNEADRLNLIERSAASIHNVINEIRGISRSLVPPSFSDLGLLDSVVDLVNDIIATKTIHVEFYHQGDFEKNSTEKLRLTLFRIIQEQVNNVIRHANAKHLVIEMMMEDEGDAIDLTITDDGIGFDPELPKNKKGMGISNIFSRTALFDGHVILVSAPGEGCKLHVHVPIQKLEKTTNNE